MGDIPAARPIIVGVDGSRHALRTAIWASEEAVGRAASLHLVSVIDCDAYDPGASYDRARRALNESRAAIEATGQLVELKSEIVWGEPATTLIEASRSAQLVCLGAKGLHDSAPRRRGATAAAIAESAFCPVAVIRRRPGHLPSPSDRWVVAVLDESPVSRGVFHTALDEAALRGAPVLALTSWPTRTYGLPHTDDDLRAELEGHLRDSERDDPGVHVWTASIPANLTRLLTQTADLDQIIIVGKNNPELIAELIGPQARSLLSKTNCSVMIVREEQDAALAAS